MIGSNKADTIEFYRDLLGMPLVLEQPNLDNPNTTHLFFDPGDGRILTFFVRAERESNPAPPQRGIGSVHHLAFEVSPENYANTLETLQNADHDFTEFDRGIARSIYTKDHNGLSIELTADKYDLPDDRLGEILAEAHQLRQDDGAEYMKEPYLESALANLGIEADRYDFSTLPDAPTGAGVKE